MLAARAKRLAFPALIVALSLSLSACMTGPEIFGQGGPDPDSSSSPYPGDAGDDGVDDNTDGETGTDGEAPLPVVGTIEVKIAIESPPTARVFTIEATECEVSTSRIWAVGAGAEWDAGTTAQLTVDTELRETLHAGTGTLSAKGSILLEIADGGEWVSDGRPHTVMGATFPAMFEYRVKGEYAEFRTAWFEAGGVEGAGYVHIWCAD